MRVNEVPASANARTDIHIAEPTLLNAPNREYVLELRYRVFPPLETRSRYDVGFIFTTHASMRYLLGRVRVLVFFSYKCHKMKRVVI